VQSRVDIPGLAGRFDVVNIKLDKSGGLTEALAMARVAHDLGLKTMVGNMFGTSLAMAPGVIAGQICNFVDLDGPILLASDRDKPVTYTDGFITWPRSLWGSAE
jgi:L-alanine-DL-glutamate epimerase-like enolase superfamily enzyme